MIYPSCKFAISRDNERIYMKFYIGRRSCDEFFRKYVFTDNGLLRFNGWDIFNSNFWNCDILHFHIFALVVAYSRSPVGRTSIRINWAVKIKLVDKVSKSCQQGITQIFRKLAVFETPQNALLYSISAIAYRTCLNFLI